MVITESDDGGIKVTSSTAPDYICAGIFFDMNKNLDVERESDTAFNCLLDLQAPEIAQLIDSKITNLQGLEVIDNTLKVSYPAVLNSFEGIHSALVNDIIDVEAEGEVIKCYTNRLWLPLREQIRDFVGYCILLAPPTGYRVMKFGNYKKPEEMRVYSDLLHEVEGDCFRLCEETPFVCKNIGVIAVNPEIFDEPFVMSEVATTITKTANILHGNAHHPAARELIDTLWKR